MLPNGREFSNSAGAPHRPAAATESQGESVQQRDARRAWLWLWGGIMTNENISLKRYMQTIWVSCPMAEDPSSEAELFGR